ncbi:Cacna1h [Symbiodinium sp. CCMP2456]|nr:Cacna1h [Symbiodinium sp. CCMP2456]
MEVGHPCTVLMSTSGPTTCSVSVLKSMGSGELPVPKTAEEGGGKMKVPVVKPDGTTSELLVQTKPLPTKSGEMDDGAKKMQEQARETVQAGAERRVEGPGQVCQPNVGSSQKCKLQNVAQSDKTDARVAMNGAS